MEKSPRLNLPPIFLPLVAFVIGILAVYVLDRFDISPRIIAFIALGTVTVSFAIIAVLYFRRLSPERALSRRHLHLIWISILFAGLGMTDMGLNLPFRLPEGDFPETITIKGYAREVTPATSGDRIVADVKTIRTASGTLLHPANMKILIHSDVTELTVDDEFFFFGIPRRIRDSHNHFPTGYAASLENKGILYECRVPGDSLHFIRKETSAKGIADGLRSTLQRQIESSEMEAPTRRFFSAVLLGNREYLDHGTRSLFAAGGVAHILALSGMHVAIIAGIILLILFPFNRLWGRRLRPLLALTLILLYTFVTGWALSTLRAALMFGAFTAAALMQRKVSALTTLSATLFFILLIWPGALFDPALQLSVLCVGSLILFASPLNPVNHHDHPFTFRVAEILLAALVTTFAAWPVMAYYFGNFPIWFLPANVILLPLLPFFILAGIIAIIFGKSSSGEYISRLVDSVYSTGTEVLEFITDGGTAAISMEISGWWIFVWLAGILLLGAALSFKLSHRYRLNSIRISTVLLVTGAVLPFVFGNHTNQPDLIFQNYNYQISAAYRSENGEERTVVFPPGRISEYSLRGMRIVSLASPFELTENLTDAAPPVDLLVISRSHTGDPLHALIYFRPASVAIHPSVRRTRETEIMTICDSLGIPVHKLRDEALHYYRASETLTDTP